MFPRKCIGRVKGMYSAMTKQSVKAKLVRILLIGLSFIFLLVKTLIVMILAGHPIRQTNSEMYPCNGLYQFYRLGIGIGLNSCINTLCGFYLYTG